ncbi:hypothetical protein Bca101_081983 [Brassica carinata]
MESAANESNSPQLPRPPSPPPMSLFKLLPEDFVLSILARIPTWEVYHANFGESICKIDEVWYSYDQRECWWYDTKRGKWRLVRGLTELCHEFCRELGLVEIGSYGGKLVIFWVGPKRYPVLETSRIWCAVILLKKYGRYDDVWGQVEWADIVLTSPWSHTVRLRCVESATTEATTNQGRIQLQLKLSCLNTITKDNMLLESSRGPAGTGFREDAK